MEYTSEKKTCQNCKNEFIIEPDDFLFYEKIKVPPPTFCPECRYKRRIIWRNYRFLTKGIEDISGKEIFTCIPPEAKIPIYEVSHWNSDNWSALDYGRDYNFSESFFRQFKKLFYSVPYPSKTIQRSIDSDYSNNCDDMKNTYLCFNATFLENCSYCFNVSNLKKCSDLTSSYNSELCYENIRVDKSYNTIGSFMCDNCVDVWFSKNCIGCSNCLGCVNQRNSSYMIFNKQYTKEEYDNKIKSLNLDTWQGFSNTKIESENFWYNFPVKYMLGSRNYNVLGEDIKDSKNVINCYAIKGGEDLKYVQDATFGGAKDSYDFTSWGLNSSQLYECLTCGENLYKLRFCYNCYPECRDLEYCIQMRRCNNCFGCVGLKDKKYCILNKQYSKDEFLSLREKIINHMNNTPYIDKAGCIYKYGEFFPIEFSPFAYNETLLNDLFPSDKIETEKNGFTWRETTKRMYDTEINSNDLPERIKDLTNQQDIINKKIKCMKCGKAYRIIPDEYNLLKNINLPLPRYCHDCRFFDRQKFITTPILQDAQCMCNGEHSLNFKYKNNQKHNHKDRCLNKFKTSYDKNKDIIYCEECYKKEIY